MFDFRNPAQWRRPDPALYRDLRGAGSLMWHRRMEFTVLQPIADAFRQRHEFFKGRIRATTTEQ
jgi:hypothetical protein